MSEKLARESVLTIRPYEPGKPIEEVARELEQLRQAALALGCILPEPFLQVAFLALPVIPHLKMTDRGLFDVDRFQFV